MINYHVGIPPLVILLLAVVMSVVIASVGRGKNGERCSVVLLLVVDFASLFFVVAGCVL